MSKQTPVQFLRKKYFETGMLYETDFEKAQQMHKEQIEEAWHDGIMGGQCGTPEEYYNETYGGNNE